MRALKNFLQTIHGEGRALLDYALLCESGEALSDLDFIISLILGVRGKVVLIGVGKSGLIAQKISATLSSTGTPSMFMHPTEAMHGDLGALSSQDCVLAISYSGESEEIISILPHIRRMGIKIITMSKDRDSRMSAKGDFFLPIIMDKEVCPLQTAPMTSTTLTLAIGDALAACLMIARDFGKKDFARFHPGGSLGRELFMKVSDIMRTEDLPIISTTDSIGEAISVMTRSMLGSAFVLDSNRLVGILSDGDLRRAMQYEGFCLDSKAFDYASKNPKVIQDSNTLAIDALKEMRDKKIQILPVLSKQGILEGVVHLYALLQAGFTY